MANLNATHFAGESNDRLLRLSPEAASRQLGDAEDRIESIYQSAYALEAIARVLGASESAEDDRLASYDRAGLLAGAEVLAKAIQIELHQVANLPAAQPA